MPPKARAAAEKLALKVRQDTKPKDGNLPQRPAPIRKKVAGEKTNRLSRRPI